MVEHKKTTAYDVGIPGSAKLSLHIVRKNKQSVQQELSTVQLYKKQQVQQEPSTQYNGTKTGARPITIHHVNVLKQYERKQELSTI
jgi:hypothetical protein